MERQVLFCLLTIFLNPVFPQALIAYMQMNKAKDNDWFRISASNPEGTKWKGRCWYVHNLLKYEFDLQFEIPATYPATAPELELPELDGKTAKVGASL
jgi:ufm1-conjugating enzyme 1